MSLLMVGLLGLAQVFYFGMAIVGTSSAKLDRPREGARSHRERAHRARHARHHLGRRSATPTRRTARRGRHTTANGGGTFVNGEQDLLAAGPDGLVDTADDAGQEMTPGPDNMLGTADDVPLVGFTREIAICDINGNAEPAPDHRDHPLQRQRRGRQPAPDLHADHLHLEVLVRTTP